MTQEQSVIPPQDGGNQMGRDGLVHPHRLPVPEPGRWRDQRSRTPASFRSWSQIGRHDTSGRAPSPGAYVVVVGSGVVLGRLGVNEVDQVSERDVDVCHV